MKRSVVLVSVIVAMPSSIAVARTAVVSPPRADRLVAEATLTASNPAGQVGFQDAAISGSTIAAITYLPSGPPGQQLGADVFTQPATGWSSGGPAALLAGPDQDQWETVAISGDQIFVGDPQRDTDGPGAIYVFSEPPGGWTGTVQPSATLIASEAGAHAELGASLSADGDTVVAIGAGAAGAAYVFTEPAGGWTGAIEPSAELTPTNGAQLSDTAISGGTVIAGAAQQYPIPTSVDLFAGAVYVFNEPGTGWAGTLHETATLSPSQGGLTGSVAFAGTSVVAGSEPYERAPGGGFGIYVFGEPPDGWSGSILQRAALTVPMHDSYNLGPWVAGTGQTVAAVTDEPGAGGVEHECPCKASIFALDEPAGGWNGTSSMTASASVGTTFQLAMYGRTLVGGDETGLHVFRTDGPPLLRHLSVTGLAEGKPSLSFAVAAGVDAPAIKSVKVALPSRLRLAGRRLVILRLKRPRDILVGRLSGPRFTETTTLARQIEKVLDFNRQNRKKRTLSLKLTITVVDAGGQNTKLPVTITIT